MAERNQLLHNAFTGGLLSPKLYGRTDVARYHTGLRQLENFVVYPQGGVQRRPGTYFVKETKTSASLSRLIPFVASSEVAYILEFGDKYIRFYTSSAQVESGGAAYEVVTPWSDSEVWELQYAQSVDVMYLCHPDFAPRCLNHFSSTSWTLTEYAYENGPYLDENELDDGTIDEDLTISVDATIEGTTGVTITTSSAVFRGDGDDVGRLVAIRHELQWGVIKITAFGTTTSATGTIQEDFLYTTGSKHWRLGAWSGYMGWPQCVCFHEQRLAFARTGKKSQTIWLSVVGDFTNHDPNVETVGANYVTNGDFSRYVAGSVSGWTGGTNWDNSTGAAVHTAGSTNYIRQTLDVADGAKYRLSYTISSMSAGTLTVTWGSSSGPARSADGDYAEYYTGPAATVYLTFAPSTDFDGTLDDVVVEAVSDISQTGEDSGLALTLSSDTYDAITWLVSQGPLLIGTIGGVYSLSANSGTSLSSTNYKIRRETSYPAKTMRPVSMGNSVLYVQKGGLVVRDIVYSFQSDAFGAADLTVWSDTVTESGIVDIARQVAPFSIFWGVRADGKLIGLTYERDQQVLAWHRHNTEGTFESVAVIPGTLEDQVWFIVRRLINGSYVRYVEYMDKFNFDSLYTAHCVDCGTYTTGSSMTSVSGLDHLEKATVQVCGDGKEQTDQTVSSGSITVDSCNYVHVGLEYDAILETMDMDPGGGPQTILARQKRVIDSTFMFYRAAAATAGYITGTSASGYAYNLNIITEEDETSIVLAGGEAGAYSGGYLYASVEYVDEFDFESGYIYTGKKRLSFPGGWEDYATVYCVQDAPLPLGLLCIVTTLAVGDR